MFNFVRLSDGGPSRYEGPRSEVDVIASLGERVLGDNSPVDWKALTRHCHLRQMIATDHPRLREDRRDRSDAQEFQIAGRTFHTPRFATPSGKAQFAVHPIPPLAGAAQQLRLMTVRSEGQFNTVVYEEEDIYRGQDRRNVILMNGADIERLGLRVDQRVTRAQRGWRRCPASWCASTTFAPATP